MRVANLSGRAVLLQTDRALDIETASGGRFPSNPQDLFDSWDDVVAWADGVRVETHAAAVVFDVEQLRSPVPRPAQIVAIGLNYAEHAGESGLDLPENPLVFTKFPSSLTGPSVEIALESDTVDWEVELVVVIGRGGRNIPESDAWDHVAGLTVGQDLSDRTVQWWGNPSQFNLGKSFAQFAPLGPAVVTLDELEGDKDDLGITSSLSKADGSVEVLQDGRTRDLIFPVPDLIARLSKIIEFYPGDLIFTGTPSGVGMGRKPPVYLAAGQTLTSSIEGLGSIVQRFV